MKNEEFIPKYIGRSDSGLKVEIKQQWRNKVVNGDKHYTHFRYKEAVSVKAAYEQECKDFHGYEGLDNIYHPDFPDGTDYKCPIYRE